TQHELQIRRIIYCRTREYFLAGVDLADDAFAGLRILEILEIADQLRAHLVVILRVDARFAGFARHANGDAIGRGRAAISGRPAPIQECESGAVATLARFAFGQLLEVHVAFLGEPGIDAHDFGRAGEAVIGGEEYLHVRTRFGDQLFDEAVELAVITQRQFAHALMETGQLALLQVRVDIR